MKLETIGTGKWGQPRRGSSSFRPDPVQSVKIRLRCSSNPAKIRSKSLEVICFQRYKVYPGKAEMVKSGKKPVKLDRPHLRPTPFAPRHNCYNWCFLHKGTLQETFFYPVRLLGGTLQITKPKRKARKKKEKKRKRKYCKVRVRKEDQDPVVESQCPSIRTRVTSFQESQKVGTSKVRKSQ